MKPAIPFLFFCIVLLISCRKKQVQEQYDLPSAAEINAVVETVIKERLPFCIRRDAEPDTLQDTPVIMRPGSPLSVELRKTPVVQNPSDPMEPLFLGSVRISGLLRDKVSGMTFFKQRDSLYLLFQNEHLKQFRIGKSVSGLIYPTTEELQENKRKRDGFVWYYDLSIPLFSADKNRVYIEVTHNCTGLCGSAYALYLVKIGGKWIIVHEEGLWIS